MKLRTLKEIGEENEMQWLTSSGQESIREYAIEWIKELKEADKKLHKDEEEWEINDFLKNHLGFVDPYEALNPIIDWIEYFFNIKESDINENNR